MGKTYREKLLDPRWQKKRLMVLERADFACQACGDKASTLHVHHGFYDARDPWDYPDWSMWCLCDGCHDTVRATVGEIHAELARLSPLELEFLLRAIQVSDLKSLSWGNWKIVYEADNEARNS